MVVVSRSVQAATRAAKELSYADRVLPDYFASNGLRFSRNRRQRAWRQRWHAPSSSSLWCNRPVIMLEKKMRVRRKLPEAPSRVILAMRPQSFLSEADED
jgi:hypothetical protein